MTDALTFDFDQVTPRMLVDFKRETGVSLLSLTDSAGDIDMGSMEPEVLAGVVWLALRMSGNPDATFDDALDVPFARLELGDGEEEADPTPASNVS